MYANDTIDKMLSIIEMEFKELIFENTKDDEYFEIYIDYYKEVPSKY